MRDNPAKEFLKRYLWLRGRVEALDRAINQAMESAFDKSVRLKEIIVKSSPAIHDPMAENVVKAVDELETLYEYKKKAVESLREILDAIDSLKDERQKQLLTMRYVNGDDFTAIMEKMHYEKTQMYVIHGRALVEINKWLEGRNV